MRARAHAHLLLAGAASGSAARAPPRGGRVAAGGRGGAELSPSACLYVAVCAHRPVERDAHALTRVPRARLHALCTWQMHCGLGAGVYVFARWWQVN